MSCGWRAPNDRDPRSDVLIEGRSHRRDGEARSAHLDVIGTIGAINTEAVASTPRSLIVVDLLGEIVPTAEGRPQFNRGVTHYPVAGTPVRAAKEADLTVVYTRPSVTDVSIGTSTMTRGTRPFRSRRAVGEEFRGARGDRLREVMRSDLVAIGDTGRAQNAHIVLLDPHNEYGKALGDLAESSMSTISSCRSGRSISRRQWGFWCAAGPRRNRKLRRCSERRDHRRRRRFAGASTSPWNDHIDTPVPYKASDLLRLIDQAMGKLDSPEVRCRTCGSEREWSPCATTGALASCSPTGLLPEIRWRRSSADCCASR